jgi:glycosyltransferase involved in cell wall biosynthesis
MKVAFITRSTLFQQRGGDTIQVTETARHLGYVGISVDIRLADDIIDYLQYDLLHFFNITRPSDILLHLRKSGKPFVLSPILVDYSLYDKKHRRGLPGYIFRSLSGYAIEYLKTVMRWLRGTDRLVSLSYLWTGQRRSMRLIVQKASLLLPNSRMEQQQVARNFSHGANLMVPNGINASLFTCKERIPKKKEVVLCVARIEGLKNQLNLIRALNHTNFQLIIIGAPARNQHDYYELCRKEAASNVVFIDHLKQGELVQHYQQAKVHVLPSWFETCGLSSLEAAAMGCNIVITDKGYTREYYEDYAFYCDPASPASIRQAVEKAAKAPIPEALQHKIINEYTWQVAAEKTAAAYRQVVSVS